MQSRHLENPLDIVVTMEDIEDIQVCQHHAGVVDDRGPGDLLVPDNLHCVLHGVNGGTVHHHLGVMQMQLCRINLGFCGCKMHSKK